jgi:hypothetical protein
VLIGIPTDPIVAAETPTGHGSLRFHPAFIQVAVGVQVIPHLDATAFK